jgi:hypothetical protein
MRVALFICDSVEALIQQEAELSDGDRVLYRTPDATPESGDVVRYLVKPPRSPGAKLEAFEGKYILVARVR